MTPADIARLRALAYKVVMGDAEGPAEVWVESLFDDPVFVKAEDLLALCDAAERPTAEAAARMIYDAFQENLNGRTLGGFDIHLLGPDIENFPGERATVVIDGSFDMVAVAAAMLRKLGGVT